MPNFTESIYPNSIHQISGGEVYMADAGEADVLVVRGVPGFEGERRDGVLISPLSHTNACVLRALFPFTAPAKVLSRDKSCGVGDRLGIAGPGHIRVFEQCDVAPVLAQQSMRELGLTSRTFADVIDAATFTVFRAGYESDFGADGDHLKTLPDIQAALNAGCTMITLDCSEHIRPADPAQPDNARAIYGEAIAFIKEVYDTFFAGANSPAELEISIDETSEATTPEQHLFIATELRRLGVEFVTMAPRFVGEFQKGVDYIGDLAAFEEDFKAHAAIARRFGYKLSIHSGSDKFSVFPIIAKYTEGKFHLKTAGTSWLEAMRVVAQTDPTLYRYAHANALVTFPDAKKYYHVTTDLNKIPPLWTLSDSELPALFEQNDARQLIHITYGFILGTPALKERLYTLWRRERQAYSDALYRHIGRHIELITGTPLTGTK
ncbi:MAG: tagaturonate epimerase family protein [Firmicutes bacterium]|nr:tagaturonate epimerase family protein [Bacillota bacterium]